MEACSVAKIMSLRILLTHPRDLCSLILRALPSLLKKFRKGHVHPPMTEETTAGTLPELPQEILMDILSLLEIPDLLRAGSVCTSWRSAYTGLRSLGQYKSSQTPCLFYTSESDGESVARLYSLAEKRSYKLKLPEPPIRTRSLIGSSNGWLVTVDDRSEMHILNPITGQQIDDLPSVSTIEQVNPIFNEYGAVQMYQLSNHTGMHPSYDPPSTFALHELRDRLHCKAFVFSDTSTGSYVVVLIHSPYDQLSFARVGDDRWTWLPPHQLYDDCFYKDGLLYAVTSWGEIHAFDLSSPVVTMKMVMPTNRAFTHGRIYIVQDTFGDLVQVWRDLGNCNLDPESEAVMFWRTGEIKIYEVDAVDSKFKEVNSLPDHVLFLGHNQSLCLHAEEYPSLKANHAYFTDDYVLWSLGFKNNRRDIGILNLDDNSVEELVSRQLWSDCPAPVWITPRL